MPIVLPPNVAPGSPVTYEFFQQFTESQDQAAAALHPATGLTAAGTSISDATTNTALVSVPSVTAAAGNVWYLRASGILAAPASGMPTLAFHAYSGGSGGTVLDNFVGNTLTASLLATFSVFDVEAWVDFWSATTAQCIVKATVSTSGSASTAAAYIAGNASATPVTVTAGASLTLNAVMGSAVSGSSFRALGGFAKQIA